VPRYFFDVHDVAFLPDGDGVELEDVDAARRQVWESLPMMAAQRHADGNMACQLRMDVRDEAGQHVYHATLTLVIERASLKGQGPLIASAPGEPVPLAGGP
jgi:hypothetical protein